MALLGTFRGQARLVEWGDAPHQGTCRWGRQVGCSWGVGGGGIGQAMNGGEGLVEVGGDDWRGDRTWGWIIFIYFC